MGGDAYSVGWLRLIRLLTQYIVPGLVAVVMLGELLSAPSAGPSLSGYASAYNYLLLVAFTLATVMMIAVCGWTVFLWDIDRLFFTLDNRIDAEIGELEKKSPDREQDGSLLGRAREMLNNAVQTVRGRSVALIEKAYWDDINAGGVLSFPQPDIAAAVEQIDKSRRDLLAPLTELVASAIPLGNLPASDRVAADLQVRCARGQSAPLPAPGPAVPLATGCALCTHRRLLLHQYPGVVSRRTGPPSPRPPSHRRVSSCISWTSCCGAHCSISWSTRIVRSHRLRSIKTPPPSSITPFFSACSWRSTSSPQCSGSPASCSGVGGCCCGGSRVAPKTQSFKLKYRSPSGERNSQAHACGRQAPDHATPARSFRAPHPTRYSTCAHSHAYATSEG